MIQARIAAQLDQEVERLRKKYNPISTQSLERIAREEYGATVIKTPLGLGSGVTKTEEGLFVFYYASFKPYEPLTLGHEIGHVAAGNLNERCKQNLWIKEKEADYFSTRLNDISLSTVNLYRLIEASLRFKDHFLNIFRYRKEIEKLQQQSAYKAFKSF